MKSNGETRATVLEIQVSASLSGHDLGPFEPVDKFREFCLTAPYVDADEEAKDAWLEPRGWVAEE